MRVIIVCLMISTVLTGCASEMPKEVKIPVVIKEPSIKIPPKPALPIAKLKKNSNPDEVIKAYAASVEILIGYNNELIKILNAYN